MRFSGEKNGRRFVAAVVPSEKTERKCLTCGGPVRRSWRTGLLHNRCFTCRYLVMVYGPSITVSRRQS